MAPQSCASRIDEDALTYVILPIHPVEGDSSGSGPTIASIMRSWGRHQSITFATSPIIYYRMGFCIQKNMIFVCGRPARMREMVCKDHHLRPAACEDRSSHAVT
ncbi:hypothetical protein [Oryza sativa Japonica Group]|uniref:Uncharacterized protein n=1 Tax=Oryza sativa subsp. japonica TaxID=39947 RepID=Q8LQW0_ORYSJ|nr:hypothetical protein [Oryza sativa Japonica Group]